MKPVQDTLSQFQSKRKEKKKPDTVFSGKVQGHSQVEQQNVMFANLVILAFSFSMTWKNGTQYFIFYFFKVSEIFHLFDW